MLRLINWHLLLNESPHEFLYYFRKYEYEATSSALVLQCIYHSETKPAGASLRNIIAFGDYTNHAIMPFAEFSSAVKNLGTIGMIDFRNNELYTSPEFKSWYAKKFSKKKTIQAMKELAEIEKFLTACTLDKVGSQTIHIDENIFSNSVDEYLKS